VSAVTDLPEILVRVACFNRFNDSRFWPFKEFRWIYYAYLFTYCNGWMTTAAVLDARGSETAAALAGFPFDHLILCSRIKAESMISSMICWTADEIEIYGGILFSFPFSKMRCVRSNRPTSIFMSDLEVGSLVNYQDVHHVLNIDQQSRVWDTHF
jgi:hypothetical protein